jgi:hypothetical protein
MDDALRPSRERIMKRILSLFALGLVTFVGCARTTRTVVPPVAAPQPIFPGGPSGPPGPGGPGGLPPGAVPAPPGSGLPAGAMILPPGGSPGAAAPPSQSPFPTAPAAPTAPTAPQSNFPTAPPSPSSSTAPSGEGLDRVGYRWQPSIPSPGPGAPTTAPPQGPTVLLLPPQADSNTPEPPRNAPKVQLYPPQNDGGSAYPVGIAGFDRVRQNVATGQRPSLEGLDWLQKQGYRSVVLLYRPGERTDADREQVEKRGMTFVAIEVDPRQLRRETVDAFFRLQRDPSAGKTFVYDLDGALAGPLWYLSYRLIDQDGHEVALIRARQLGLREEREGVYRDAWQTVRRFLEEQGVR